MIPTLINPFLLHLLSYVYPNTLSLTQVRVLFKVSRRWGSVVFTDDLLNYVSQ